MSDDDDEDDDGVEHGPMMKRLAREILSQDVVAHEAARTTLADVAGAEAASFVVGVAAFFDAINRLADATGTRLDDEVEIPEEVDLSAMGSMGF